MDCIQNFTRSMEGFHRHHSCAFCPSRHRLSRSICFCEPPQPLEVFMARANRGSMSGGEKMRKLLCAFFVLGLALCFTTSGWGQSQITAGTVQGDVLDEKGG